MNLTDIEENMHLTDIQTKVFNEAKRRLEKQPWFRGVVCLDNFPSHEECVNNFEDAVVSVEMETTMWDAPQGIFTKLGA